MAYFRSLEVSKVLLYTFLRARIRETRELETPIARVWDPQMTILDHLGTHFRPLKVACRS
jgi:hypothetical protein